MYREMGTEHHHPPQARGLMHMLAARRVYHHTDQASGRVLSGPSIAAPVCDHIYGDCRQRIMARSVAHVAEILH